MNIHIGGVTRGVLYCGLIFISSAAAFAGSTTSPPKLGPMKDIQNLGMPWEQSYGYAQAVRVGNTVWLSGQFGHDARGNLVGSDTESQMRQAYANIQTLLSRYGLTMDNIVEETAFVTDVDAAIAARTKIGRIVYRDPTRVTSNLIGVSRLFLPLQKIEIKVTAIVH